MEKEKAKLDQNIKCINESIIVRSNDYTNLLKSHENVKKSYDDAMNENEKQINIYLEKAEIRKKDSANLLHKII